MKKKIRIGLAVTIITLTIAAFVWYLSDHTYLLHQLAKTPPVTIVALVLLYGLWFICLAFILEASLRICRKKLGM